MHAQCVCFIIKCDHFHSYNSNVFISCENADIYMQLFMTKICSLISENVALRKTTDQSPECVGYEGAGSLAVDGNTTTEFGDVKPHACTCVRQSPSTYLSVDLGQSYPVYNIKIYQRNLSKFAFRAYHLFIY